MMKKTKQKLTFDRLATYQIKVPEELDERWSDWDGKMTITIESDIITTNNAFNSRTTLGSDFPVLQFISNHVLDLQTEKECAK